MADKPSNSRKKVSFQPARDGQAARWSIEDNDDASSRKRLPRDQRERAQARLEERKRTQADRASSSDDRAGSTRARRQREVVRDGERAVRERSAAAVRKAKTAFEPSDHRRARAASPAKVRSAKAGTTRAGSARKPEATPDRDDERSARAVVSPQRARTSARPERVLTEGPQKARHAASERTRANVMEAMLPGSGAGSSSHSTVFGLPMRTVIVAVLLAVIVVFFLWHPWSQGHDAVTVDPGEQAPVSDVLEERFTTVPTYGIVAPVDFNAVEEEGFTAGFVLAHGGVVTDYSLYDTEPELSDESAQALNEALQPFTDNDALTAFLLMDIQTGRGFARNIDKKLYGASSFKGPYCAYLLKRYVDGGDTKLSDSFASGYMTASLGYARSGTDSLDDLIEETIVDSSNDAFASLRVNFSDNTLSQWLTSVDVDGQVAYDTWFPFNTARNMAKLWMETYYYLQTSSEAANTLKGYLGSTTVSFMREALTGVKALEEEAALVETERANEGSLAVSEADDGLIAVSDADGGLLAVSDADDGQTETSESGESATDGDDDAALEETATLKVTGSVGRNLGNVVEHAIDVIMAPEITVYDKAGWNIDGDENYNALVDCGIVSCNGRDYLLCVMSDAAYTESNVDDFERLIAAVFNARQDLA